MVPVHILPKNVAHYLICVDDSPPSFEVDSWVKIDTTYRLMGVADALNHGDEVSYIIADATTNKIIRPSIDYRGFRGSRFESSIILHLN